MIVEILSIIFSLAVSLIISITYVYGAIVALASCIRVYPKVTGAGLFSIQLQVFVDGGEAFTKHVFSNSFCPWVMVKPSHLTWTEHLTNVFLSYPRYTIAWAIDNYAVRLEAFGAWLLKEPAIFVASVFVLIYSGVALFFCLKALLQVASTILKRAKRVSFAF